MPAFERRQTRTRNSHLIAYASPDRAGFRAGRAENPILAPQRALGNQSAQRFAQSCSLRLPTPGLCPVGGVCHVCPTPVQAKLRVDQPGDRFEQEANRIADVVMRMPETGVIREARTLTQPPTRRTCSDCEEQEGDAERTIQTKRLGDQIPGGNVRPAAGMRSLKSGGQPLPEAERSFFESRFGHDFSQVRVHTDTRAAKAARDIHAQAFTTGWHLFFGAGRYSPGGAAGRHLLAHELTHVIQQRALAMSGNDDPGMIQRQPLGCTPGTTDLPADRNPVLDVETAHHLAQAWAQAALDQVEIRVSGRVDASIERALNRHFSNPTDSQVRFIRNILRIMVARLNQGTDIYRCNSRESRSCQFCGSRRPEPGNWACTPSGGPSFDRYRTRICPPFFRHDLEERAHCLVHEAAHNAGIQGEGQAAYPGTNPTYNAEPYARFASEVFVPLRSHTPISPVASSRFRP